jgi:hypothetical protein
MELRLRQISRSGMGRAREVVVHNGRMPHRWLRKRLPAVVLFVAVLSSAGCGGGSSTPAASVPAKSAPGAPSASASSTSASSQPPAQDKSTSTHPGASGDHLSSAQFIASADAICARLNSELNAEAPKNAGMPEVGRVASRRAAAETTALSELGQLTPPASLVHAWPEVIAYRQARVENLRSLAKYASSSDSSGVSSAVTAGEGLMSKLRAAAGSAGLTACSEDG